MSIIGQRFGRWLVTGEAPPRIQPNGKRRAQVECRCDCGTTRVVCIYNLTFGLSHGCGCARRETARRTFTTHGDSKTHLHAVWRRMLTRCRNHGKHYTKWYADRGIHVCEEWQEFTAFRDWALARSDYRPGLEIDRIDNDGDYTPDNCRWATRGENCSNTSRSHRLTAFGETQTVTEWSRDYRCAVPVYTLRQRIAKGWPPELAIAFPPGPPGG